MWNRTKVWIILLNALKSHHHAYLSTAHINARARSIGEDIIWLDQQRNRLRSLPKYSHDRATSQKSPDQNGCSQYRRISQARF